MYKRRWVAVVLPVAMIVVACTGGAEETTTGPSTTSATTSTSIAATTTVGQRTGEPIPEAPPASCFYLDGYLVVDQGQGDAAVTALEEFDVRAAVVSASEVLGDSEAVATLDESIDLLSTTVDSFDVATALLAAQIAASPVYAVGLASHWRFKPGTDPISRPGVALPGPTATPGEGVLAVVDSGIVEDRRVDWMSPGSVLYDPVLDTETIGGDPRLASHGTFVTSIIRRLAPEYRVAFASAHPVAPDLIVQNEDTLPADIPYVSTELHVAEAIVRLTQRPELTGNVAALNLSLGTYTCHPGEDPTMVTTMAALRLWFGEFPNSTVFAAAGNEPYQAPFWPAGLSAFQIDPTVDPAWVRGIAAVNANAEQVVWGTTASAAVPAAIRPMPRRWVTDLAPGCDLLGLRGGTDDDGATVVAWSGSSFASAVTAALDTAGAPPISTGPQTEYDYTVPGLAFEQLGSCDLP